MFKPAHGGEESLLFCTFSIFWRGCLDDAKYYKGLCVSNKDLLEIKLFEIFSKSLVFFEVSASSSEAVFLKFQDFWWHFYVALSKNYQKGQFSHVRH